jgi:hypothetical protein
MRIQILQQLVGPAVNMMPGDIVDLPADEARRLIDAGIAEAVADERATQAEPPRKATRR